MTRYHACAICGSKNRTFRFPSGNSRKDIRDQWIKFSGVRDKLPFKKQWFLCGAHFEDNCFRNVLKEKLLSFAVPTLKPPMNLEFQNNNIKLEPEEESENNISEFKYVNSQNGNSTSVPEIKVEPLSDDEVDTSGIASQLESESQQCHHNHFDRDRAVCNIDIPQPTAADAIAICVEPDLPDMFDADLSFNSVTGSVPFVTPPIECNSFNSQSHCVKSEDISFQSDCFEETEVTVPSTLNTLAGKKETRLINKLHRKPGEQKKKWYDPVLIDSILKKMKLDKKGPISVVMLEKKRDRLYQNFKNHIVTLYKQQIKKMKSMKKIRVNDAENTGSSAVKKVRRKRKCTCTIHCSRTQLSKSNVDSNTRVGMKFEGVALNKNVLDPEILAEEELFNAENIFNVSTILTNIHDKLQMEQLCQMLVESVFKLKNINVEGTMAKLNVYIAQIPSSNLDKNVIPETSHVQTNQLVVNRNIKQTNLCNSEADGSISTESLSKEPSESCEILKNDNISCLLKRRIDINEKYLSSHSPVSTDIPNKHSISSSNIHHLKSKSNNVMARLSSFHDHNYIKHENNYIFEKPEYLVKLIDIATYRKTKCKPRIPLSVLSKKQIQKHENVCKRLNNKISQLRGLLNKKTKSIQNLNRKVKYLGTLVSEKEMKFAKDNVEEIQVLVSPEDLISTKRKRTRRENSLKPVFVHLPSVHHSSHYCIPAPDQTSGSKVNRIKQKHRKKNESSDSIDNLNEIDEIYCDIDYS